HTSESVIRDRLKELLKGHPLTSHDFEAVEIWRSPDNYLQPQSRPVPKLAEGQSPVEWLVGQIRRMGREMRRHGRFGLNFGLSLAEERRQAEAARLRQNQDVAKLQRLQRQQKRALALARPPAPAPSPLTAPRREPLPPVPVRFEKADIPFQESAIPL